MTVEDNIRAMLQTTSKKSDEIEAIVESLIEEFHIGHVRDRMGMQLSGGERRRVENCSLSCFRTEFYSSR